MSLWLLFPGNCRWCLTGHIASVSLLKLDPTGCLCLSTDKDGRDRSIRMWDLNKGALHFGNLTLSVSKNMRFVTRWPDSCLHTKKKHNSLRNYVQRTVHRASSGGLPGVAGAPDERARCWRGSVHRSVRTAGKHGKGFRTKRKWCRVLTKMNCAVHCWGIV